MPIDVDRQREVLVQTERATQHRAPRSAAASAAARGAWQGQRELVAGMPVAAIRFGNRLAQTFRAPGPAQAGRRRR